RTSEKMSDEELLSRHVAGDAESFRELVHRYTPELSRFLMRFLGRQAWTEDAIQETFLQVHVSAGTFDPARRVKPWLFTIAANKARDLLRSRSRRREVSIGGSPGDQSGDVSVVTLDILEGAVEPPPTEGTIEDETAGRVRRVVATLPGHLREVLILGYFHRFQYKEIAGILNVPIGTVKSRLHAAVAQFGAAYRRVESTESS
ncbi:MAG: RNA polymerase sigma factor, partial [Phycisphaerae bacterium]